MQTSHVFIVKKNTDDTEIIMKKIKILHKPFILLSCCYISSLPFIPFPNP